MRVKCKADRTKFIAGSPKVCEFDIRMNVALKICCPGSTDPQVSSKNGTTFNGVTEVSVQNRAKKVTKIVPVTTKAPDISDGDCSNSPGISKEVHYHGLVDAKQGAWPWMVVISKTNNKGFSSPECAAFMISKRHMISFAHCFEEKNHTYSARIGHVDLRRSKTYHFNEIKIHEDYIPKQLDNDIALITLTRDVKFPHFTPVCLPAKSVENLVGRETTVVFWEAAWFGGPSNFNLKQIGGMPVVPEDDCPSSFAVKFGPFNFQVPTQIDDQTLCAGFMDGKNKDKCGIYSDKYLMVLDDDRWYVVGMRSSGYECGLGKPVSYIRVSEYVDWINENKH